MRTLALSALISLAALAACSDDDPVEPKPPVVQTVELHYDFRYGAQEGTDALKSFEYANENGVVIVVENPSRPVWDRDMTLKTGDRIYMRAEIEFSSVFWGVVQISGPGSMYYSSLCERVDGPGTCVIEVDQIVE